IHPDVIAKQKEVDQVKEQMDSLIDDWKEKIKIKQEKLEKNPNPGITAAEAEIKLAEGEIRRQQKAVADNETAIASIVDRINKVPGVEVALGAIEREYQTKKSAYDDLLVQQQKIGLNADAI